MKGKGIFAVILALVLLIAIGSYKTEEKSSYKAEYLRLHIRADSNDYSAQSIKYEIKDEVVAFLTPIVANCKNKKESVQAIENNLENIENLTDKILKEKGYTYTSTAQIKREEFPVRAYDEYVLDAGVYDALIINLGSGEGDNWWCVVYPPLCFTKVDTFEGFKYKSKILEIIERFYD